MAILYVKLENTAQILRALLKEQIGEVQIAKAQADKAAKSANEARQNFNHAEERMKVLVLQVNQIQDDVKDSLAKSAETNRLVVEAAKASKNAADEAANEAARAAGTAGAAANAASRAASLSSHTSSVVATKVVTSQDKRQLAAQQAALAQKQRQLNKTIKRVKVNGPTLLDKIFHP